MAARSGHEEGSSGGNTFWDVLKLTGRIKLIPWPEIRSARRNMRWTGTPGGTPGALGIQEAASG
eukprot:351397-Chlamydomonas_euryale.AAC.2